MHLKYSIADHHDYENFLFFLSFYEKGMRFEKLHHNTFWQHLDKCLLNKSAIFQD